MVRSAYMNHGTQVVAAPTTATPARQSRAPAHRPIAHNAPIAHPHHSTGVPSAVTWRRQVLPAGAGQVWVEEFCSGLLLAPGLMSFSAEMPTGRLSRGQPSGCEAYGCVEHCRN